MFTHFFGTLNFIVVDLLRLPYPAAERAEMTVTWLGPLTSQ